MTLPTEFRMRIDHVAYHKAARVAIFGLLLQVAVGLIMLVLARSSGDTGLEVASTYALPGVLVWAALALVFHQHRLERLEAMEREELAATRGDTSIFERSTPDQEAAARRLRQMHQWLVPIVRLGGAAGGRVMDPALPRPRIEASFVSMVLTDFHVSLTRAVTDNRPYQA